LNAVQDSKVTGTVVDRSSEDHGLSASPLGASAAEVITVQDLSVRLSLQREKMTSLREYAIKKLKGAVAPSEVIWPLQAISFSVKKGEVFGVVGRNGAGKSTMLKVIAGVLPPFTGHVRVCGRIAPLLELGAGFEPELTAAENVLLYGSLLGLSRRALRERLPHILEFSELQDFSDVPMKNYSTGMAARLGFSVAMEVDADILLVDEVFAVGDSFFERKCIQRIDAFRAGGGTVLVVSHDLNLIRKQCHRALYLEHGRCKTIGSPDEVVDAYLGSHA
jgi:homopolymeric O-antigen transport system ATP-binding protein